MKRPLLLGDIVERNALLYRHKEAIAFAGTTEHRITERISFENLNERVNRVANMLLKMGVRKGDRVAILDYDTIPRVEVEFGAFKIGAVLVPPNWRLIPEELSWILTNSEPKVLIARDEFVEGIETIREDLTSVENFVGIGGKRKYWNSYEDLTAAASKETPPDPGITDDDLAMLIYTAGSTGRPKGVMLSHKNFLSVAAEGHTTSFIRFGDRSLIASPIFHSGGHAIFLQNVYLGNTIILMERFDPQFLLEIIEKEKATFVTMIVTMCRMVTEMPELKSYDLGSMRGLCYGGSPSSMALLNKLFDVLPPRNVGYSCVLGATESTGFCITVLGPQDHILEGNAEEMKKKQERLISVGIPAPNIMIKIGDEGGQEVPFGESGELLLRGPHIMKGYWRNPEATKEAFVDGWFRLADVCKMDDEGYVYLLDRKHNMIISGGENIYPAEVERVLSEHPAISECAVIGVPHERWGETVKAIVTLKAGMSASEEEIIEFCGKHLARFKKPKSVDFVDEIPKAGPLKIDKQKLRRQYWGDVERRIG